MMIIITAIVLIILGAILAAGGIWLLIVGGSWFYLALGLGFMVTAILLFRRRHIALFVYGIVLIVTLAWALWEVGFDWWGLVPRGVIPTLIGIWLLLPWSYRSPRASGETGPKGRPYHQPFWRGSFVTLAVAVALSGVVALVSIFTNNFDIKGELAANSTGQALTGAAGDDWPAYGGSAYGQRYSTLTDITPETAGKLTETWVYHTGDKRLPTDPGESTFEVTPLKIGNRLYLCTPHAYAIALDATTGEKIWQFDPKVAATKVSEHLTCRGLSYHSDRPASAAEGAAPAITPPALASAPGARITTQCTKRLLLPTGDARLFALDATTGQPCADFGENGVIRLSDHMPNMKPGFYMVTSPPVIVGDLAIIGAAINDNVSAQNPSGVIRAYDVHSGKLVWNWDPGNPDQTEPLAPGQTYTAGAPNAWSILSADPALGLVYVPLGNQSPDQFGAARTPEVERFSSAVVALDVATGKLRWVFQTVHHDLWDYDVPAQPTLVDLTIAGATVPAIIAPTKQGSLYVLDRRTGQPLVPVTEVAVPKGAVDDDHTAPTQPISALNFMPPPLREQDMWGVTLYDQLACRIRFKKLRYDGPYTPPSLQGTVVYPGNTGVFNWGGVAVDPARQVLIGTPLWLAFVTQEVPRTDDHSRFATKAQPGYAQDMAAFGENYGGPFAIKIAPFVSALGIPCQSPPWGSIVGVDLTTHKTVWRHRNGTVRDHMPLVKLPLRLGVPGLGGPLITAGGVAFYSGTLDNYLRAYDVSTGKLLWQGRLPAGGQATPMTYRAEDGRQMVVVAAGGHGSFGTTLGDAVVAYALPPAR